MNCLSIHVWKKMATCVKCELVFVENNVKCTYVHTKKGFVNYRVKMLKAMTQVKNRKPTIKKNTKKHNTTQTSSTVT